MARKYEVFIAGRSVSFSEEERKDVLEKEGTIHLSVSPDELRTELEHALLDGTERPILVLGDDLDAIWKRFQEQYRLVVAAGGAVSDGTDRLLVIRRFGKWDLPKGKVEVGERISDAAVREVQEECGLRDVQLGPALCSTWHTYDQKGRSYLKRTDWFLMHADPAQALTAQAEEGIEEVRWVRARELAEVRRDTYASLQAVFSAWESAVGR